MLCFTICFVNFAVLLIVSFCSSVYCLLLSLFIVFLLLLFYFDFLYLSSVLFFIKLLYLLSFIFHCRFLISFLFLSFFFCWLCFGLLYLFMLFSFKKKKKFDNCPFLNLIFAVDCLFLLLGASLIPFSAIGSNFRFISWLLKNMHYRNLDLSYFKEESHNLSASYYIFWKSLTKR